MTVRVSFIKTDQGAVALAAAVIGMSVLDRAEYSEERELPARRVFGFSLFRKRCESLEKAPCSTSD